MYRSRLVRGELELDLRDRRRGVEALRARARTVEDRVAAVQAQLVLELFLALRAVCVLYSCISVFAWEGSMAWHALGSRPSSGRQP